MSRDLSLLHPKLREIIPVILGQCEAVGLHVLITDGYRSKAEQDALYAQGRTTPGQIVTQVRYPNSAHNWGVAFDFCRNERGREYNDADHFFKRVADIAKQHGLEWGGDWIRFVDKPHLQLPEFMPYNSTAYLRSAYGSPEQFRKTWPTKQEEDNDDMRFQTIDDVPEYGRMTVYKLMDKGILLGDGNPDVEQRVIDLNADMLRILVMLDRIGFFNDI